MPDDSSGIYSVPAGTIVTTGDNILPSQHNPWANDSASAVSNRFSKDGRAPATGNWNINNFRLTNVGAPVAGGDAVNKTYADAISTSIETKLDTLQPSVDVASAAATDIGAAASQNVRITGTVTITNLGTAAAGTFRRLRFADVLTLTYNATSLILPGGTSITTAAGDVAEFVSEGSGNWRCVDYIRSFPLLPFVGPTSLAGTSVDFTGIPAWATEITITFSQLSLSGTANPLIQIGDSGGIETTGYVSVAVSAVTPNTVVSSNFTAGFGSTSGAAANSQTGVLTLSLLSSNTWILGGVSQIDSTATITTMSGRKALSDILDRIRFTTSNGTDTFDSGSAVIRYK